MSMLMAIDNGFQACLMAPTEILANQHFQSIGKMGEKIGLNVQLLTGSTKKKDRETLHAELSEGKINILIGTHALIEDTVVFQKLGLVIIDVQHRFGVAQRAKLWTKTFVRRTFCNDRYAYSSYAGNDGLRRFGCFRY